jgi:ketosteroid isomerase-like protein
MSEFEALFTRAMPAASDLLRAGFAALDREGIEGIIPLFHPDFEVEVTPELSVEPDTYRGEAGIRRYFRSFEESMEEIRFHPDELIDVGDQVVVVLSVTARGRGTGIPVEQRIAQLWTFEGDRARRVVTYVDKDAALAAADASA